MTILVNDVDNFLPRSHATVQKWLMAEFDKKKLKIKQQLHEDFVSKIHLTFDMWTSENQLALLGIVAHYLDGKKWKNQSRLLALKEVEGAHSGENMTAYISEVVNEYEITDKIGFFTLDNAKSNDICLRIFLRTCLPDITDEAIKARRIRCFGHVVNLAAKAFLFGKNADVFEVEDALNVALDRQMEEMEAWRKHGPVEKLHNLGTWIKRTLQRISLFKQISLHQVEGFQNSVLDEKTKDLGIIVDTVTRWNSTLDMIERDIAKREVIEILIAKLDRERDLSKRVPLENRLSNDDWLILTETADILKPFKDLTIWLQSRAEDATHGSV